MEELLNKKMEIARHLFDLNLGNDQTRRLIDFLKAYIRFDEPEINNIFDEQINLLTNKIETMGITEQIIDMAKQEGIKAGVNKGIITGRKQSLNEVSKKMLDEGCDLNFIHKVTSVPLRELEKMKNEL